MVRSKIKRNVIKKEKKKLSTYADKHYHGEKSPEEISEKWVENEHIPELVHSNAKRVFSVPANQKLVMNPDKVFKKMEKFDKEIEAEKRFNNEFNSINSHPSQLTEIGVLTEKQLPLSIEGIKQITLMDVNNPRKYYKLNTISQIQSADPFNVVYAMHDGKVEYYADISKLPLERKHKLIKSNLKRPRLLFKIKSKTTKTITAYSMKKTLLGKLKIRYRRKK